MEEELGTLSEDKFKQKLQYLGIRNVDYFWWQIGFDNEFRSLGAHYRLISAQLVRAIHRVLSADAKIGESCYLGTADVWHRESIEVELIYLSVEIILGSLI